MEELEEGLGHEEVGELWPVPVAPEAEGEAGGDTT